MKNTFTISVQILLLFFPFLIEGQSYRTKDVDALCVTVNCGLQSTACFLDGECAKVFTIFRQNDFMFSVYLLSTSSCKVQEGNDNELLKAALLHMILMYNFAYFKPCVRERMKIKTCAFILWEILI